MQDRFTIAQRGDATDGGDRRICSGDNRSEMFELLALMADGWGLGKKTGLVLTETNWRGEPKWRSGIDGDAWHERYDEAGGGWRTADAFEYELADEHVQYVK